MHTALIVLGLLAGIVYACLFPCKEEGFGGGGGGGRGGGGGGGWRGGGGDAAVWLAGGGSAGGDWGDNEPLTYDIVQMRLRDLAATGTLQ